MTRFTTVLRQELRLLARYGVLGAALLLTAVWAVALQLLPPTARQVGLELVVFTQLGVVGYSFIGALVLLEKAEHSSLALAVTPLPLGERLLARVAALTGVAVAATGVVVLAAGARLSPAPFAAGVVAMSAVSLLASLAMVASYRSVAQWALPSAVPLLVLALPLVVYLGSTSPLLWLLPTHGALVLLRGPEDTATLVAACAVSVAWSWVLAVVATRRHARWVVTADA